MITFTTITKKGNGTWEFNWITTGADYYRVVLDGVLLDSPIAPPYTCKLSGWNDEPPPIELVESDDLAESEENLPYLLIQWWPEREAYYYEVQQYVNSSWTNRNRIMENGSAFYSVRTRVMEDEEVTEWRVIAFNRIDVASDPINYTALIVSPPTILMGETEVGYNSSITSIVVSEL